MNTLPDHVRRATREPVEVVDYDPAWPARFSAERDHLRAVLPAGLIGRIEHFGSTAVPGLAAKPIIDMLVEVGSLEDVRLQIAPLLAREAYEFFWRPRELGGLAIAYAWFIKRDERGRRTHHIHMLEKDSVDWERLLFRDYLVTHPEAAREYGELKRRVAAEYPDDRVAYARAKTDFITAITARARQERAGG